MLNDLKDWALEKTDQTKEIAEGVATEVQTKGVMDWSGTVWLVIAGVVVFVLISIAQD
ncbi:hypothetical protein JF546_07935 [Nitratireductor aquimarinus]|uniref:hypothetical protein n=1 Tax=Nitratireductor aquimarinus TaxID=889300 RepID=UPI001A8F5049|nr:hypothetical protein [Nitratireductor aquimarinus]MBN8242935.1 hypothetical protein [Nitratireductor aquimarinus]MBY6132036.1 hypothetical protein [Nitratireductor aquimarinus]MCA1301572.1 hypothetical protein [Nitratireductor aquimarinus]